MKKLEDYWIVEWYDGYKWLCDRAGDLGAVALYSSDHHAKAHVVARKLGWPNVYTKRTRLRIRKMRLPIQ